MNGAALATAQAALLDRMKRLHLRLRAVERPAANGHGDEGDAAAYVERRDEAFTVLDRIALELGEIEAALRRMEAGTWGSCLECGEAIAPRRLAARPETPYCLRCAERKEFEASRLRGPDRRPAPWPADEAC